MRHTGLPPPVVAAIEALPCDVHIHIRPLPLSICVGRCDAPHWPASPCGGSH